MPKYTIGVDFGTESARAVLVDVRSGHVAATATAAYAHGVIDRTLPGQTARLPPDWALQHPGDWLEALEQVLRSVGTGISPDDIVGLGIDFTSCTVLPTTVTARRCACSPISTPSRMPGRSCGRIMRRSRTPIVSTLLDPTPVGHFCSSMAGRHPPNGRGPKDGTCWTRRPGYATR